MAHQAFVAVDLGAESGRVMVGVLRRGKVELEQLHRFDNIPVRTPDGLHWDILRLYAEVLRGLQAAAARYGDTIAGVGVDSWAVDYGLIDAVGRLLGNPYHYRDARTDGIPDEVAQCVPAAEQYARVGIAHLPINTLYQLFAQAKANDGTLDLSRSLLMIPDLLHYWLTGLQTTEYTNASTTGALGVDRAWATDFLARLLIPAHMLLPPTPPGTVLGELQPAVREECGLGAVRVILPATHDTASAIAAVSSVPHSPDATHAYISSGTWSLFGLELDRPILTEDARRAGFTNEGGVGGSYCFLRNIMGLWLIQECRRSWARQGHRWTYQELTEQVGVEPSRGVIVDVDDPAFFHPDDMPAAIGEQLQRTGQAAVTEPVPLARAIFEGLALSYRATLEQAERLANVRVETIHVVGGGSRNTLLCQLTADACRRPVLAGPPEATAMGNVLVQAMGAGEIRNLAEVHAVARASTKLTHYEPRAVGDWDERIARLHALRASYDQTLR